MANSRKSHSHQAARRSVLLGGAALLGTLVPKAGHTLLFTAQGDAPTSSPSGGGMMPKPLEGKTALITGSTDGLGHAVAMRLARMGARVLVHGRDQARGNALVASINQDTIGCAKFYRANFACLRHVRELAAAVREDNDRIDLLINNAGIGVADNAGARDRELSADGYELRFAVNYLAGFLLTRMLLPTIIDSAPARIVNVASLSQQPIDFDNIMLEHDYRGSRAYSQSKLAQIMFTQDLAEELAGAQVIVNSLHPATYMDTTMVRSAGLEPRTSVEEGAEALVYLATSADLENTTGKFFDGKLEVRANAMAYDAQARHRLRVLSERLVNA